MSLDVLSFLQLTPPASSQELGVGGEAQAVPAAPVTDFAAVFAQWMPVAPEGQNVAVGEEPTTGQAPSPEPVEPDPASTWIAPPTLPTEVVAPLGLALQTRTVGSGQMQLITPSQPSPEIEGDALVAFAQGQGLDEHALARLFGERLTPTAQQAPATTVVSAASWIAAEQKKMGLHAPANAPDPVAIGVVADRLPVDRVVLALTPVRRASDLAPTRHVEPASPALPMSEEGRVDLDFDLDVGGMLAELTPEADLKALKAEERVLLSLRIGEMLAQRMVAQAQRGQWQLRFALNPQNLGRVEIDMQMRGGELEAHFSAWNPVTRELLQEALPRLREMLQQSGMDVASLNIGSGGASKNGGHPTPNSTALGPKGSPAAGADGQTDIPLPLGRTRGMDGWDIWV